jgi:hypothetical protein
MAFIDSTVTNVALPRILESLGATAADSQWIVESYALFLSTLILAAAKHRRGEENWPTRGRNGSRLRRTSMRRFMQMFQRQRCSHTSQIKDVEPSAQGCEDCLRTGDTWVHLRECLICGHVGCCDQSPNRHATKHFHATEHPIIRSLEPGEDWRWCYVDEVLV